MAPLAVDPAALSGAGAAVSAVGDGVAAAAAGALTTGFSANAGEESAGPVFGLAYHNTAEQLLKAVASGADGCGRVGFLIQVTVSNYSKAEADSTLGGDNKALALQAEPSCFAVPGAPWSLGPGVGAAGVMGGGAVLCRRAPIEICEPWVISRPASRIHSCKSVDRSTFLLRRNPVFHQPRR